MKTYVCAISLLMCGLTYFATQVATQDIEMPPGLPLLPCEWNGKLYGEGIHKVGNCAELTCYNDGEVIIKECPLVVCPSGYNFGGYKWPDYNQPFPNCCARFTCIEKHRTWVGK
ncbi:uncharacterized protein LOC105829348 [Monomorium pharaonis]|uniref:uncharacterized protein LOC105829348 n=1 Tax=Monomorium pharaonis TaxID=307658 RepID=UPI00063FD0BC|nr:uncharacterized protein LOC105829348 [Monomorium pharaonis]